MTEAWGVLDDMAKDSVNQMIGLWASESPVSYFVRTSNSPEDGDGAWSTIDVKFETGRTTYCFRNKVSE